MDKLISSFGTYWKDAQFDTILFWAFPFCTILLIWLLTTVGLKLLNKSKDTKTVFSICTAWKCSALFIAAVIVAIICYWWSQNYFSSNHLELTLLLSLTIAFSIAIVSMVNLRNYFTAEDMKEIVDQPKTNYQLENAIVHLRGKYNRTKLCFIIPLFGFLFLLFYLYKGTNLISLVYDNSGSMTQTNAIDAVSETFDNLQENNEITFTTMDGLTMLNDPSAKNSLNDLMLISKSSSLKGGNVASFNNPSEAKGGLSQASNACFGSPICEAIWKTYLFIKETKLNQVYKNKILIVITDGMDNIDESLKSGKFLFDNKDFAEYFSPENVFVIDYSGGIPSSFMHRCEVAGCDIYPAENDKQTYLNALDNALQSFKNNWYLICWTIIIVSIFTIIGLLIQPKKIV